MFEAVPEEMRAVALVVIWAEDDQATLSVSSKRLCAKASHGLGMPHLAVA